MMIFRRVLEELEARLTPAGAGGAATAAAGKLEFKRYGDGRQRMKIKARGLDLADGTKLELLSGKTLVANLSVRKGRAEIDEERDGSANAPPLAAGTVVTLCLEGRPLLHGELKPD